MLFIFGPIVTLGCCVRWEENRGFRDCWGTYTFYLSITVVCSHTGACSPMYFLKNGFNEIKEMPNSVIINLFKASKTAWRKFCELCPGGIVTALGWFPHSSICRKTLLLVASSTSASLDAHHHITSWQIAWPYVGKNGSSDIWKRLWVVESNG